MAAVTSPLIDAQVIAALKAQLLAFSPSVSERVSTAWASAGLNMRGGPITGAGE